jgi:hypothetical protein
VGSPPARRWIAFLRNHRETIAAMDFFTVPTIRFGILYAFFIIAHDRRRILHFNVTRHPPEAWVVQQLRDPFPYESAQKYLIFDRDTKFGSATITASAIDGQHADPDFVPQPLAEWRCGALGRKLSEGFTGSGDRLRGSSFEATSIRVRALLPR